MIVCCLTSRGPLTSTINDYELINKYIVNAKLILLFPAAVSYSSKLETLL
jgi:hypothetical protein